MDKIIPFTIADLVKVTNHRIGEVKFGEKMIVLPKDENLIDFITQSTAKYVLFGIPEDVGVRANCGRAGTETAWESAISSITNIQHNRFAKGSRIIVLGTLDTSVEMDAAKDLDHSVLADQKKLRELVTQIDKEVVHVVSTIIKCGKIPIIIGGGHNNAYGNIKGTALGLGKPINVVNFDAHSDFRILEGRHSGNGFSYAFEEAFLNKYFIFGLHENYTAKKVLDRLKKLPERVIFNTYDEIKIRGEKDFNKELKFAMDFIKDEVYGIEIDLDALPNIASSAMTCSGFSVEEARQFVTHFSKHENAKYLHICEGAPTLGDEKNMQLIGKLIGYLVTDFMKGKKSIQPPKIIE